MKKKAWFLLTIVALGLVGGLVNYLTPAASAKTNCLIRIITFDEKINDAALAESLMIKGNLIKSNDFVTAIQNKALPFDSGSADSVTVERVLSDLYGAFCKVSAGTSADCYGTGVSISMVCVGTNPPTTPPTGNTIDEARIAYNQRIASMNTCQQEVFSLIQNSNNEYLQKARVANDGYYQKLAPLTIALRKNYRYAKDDSARKMILDNYKNANKTLRQGLYKDQTGAFDEFASKRVALQSQFDACK